MGHAQAQYIRYNQLQNNRPLTRKGFRRLGKGVYGTAPASD